MQHALERNTYLLGWCKNKQEELKDGTTLELLRIAQGT